MSIAFGDSRENALWHTVLWQKITGLGAWHSSTFSSKPVSFCHNTVCHWAFSLLSPTAGLTLVLLFLLAAEFLPEFRSPAQHALAPPRWKSKYKQSWIKAAYRLFERWISLKTSMPIYHPYIRTINVAIEMYVCIRRRKSLGLPDYIPAPPVGVARASIIIQRSRNQIRHSIPQTIPRGMPRKKNAPTSFIPGQMK